MNKKSQTRVNFAKEVLLFLKENLSFAEINDDGIYLTQNEVLKKNKGMFSFCSERTMIHLYWPKAFDTKLPVLISAMCKNQTSWQKSVKCLKVIMNNIISNNGYFFKIGEKIE